MGSADLATVSRSYLKDVGEKLPQNQYGELSNVLSHFYGGDLNWQSMAGAVLRRVSALDAWAGYGLACGALTGAVVSFPMPWGSPLFRSSGSYLSSAARRLSEK
jgi:hypothetical protein